MTYWEENVRQFANRDRAGTADTTMDVACRTAIRILRDGRRQGDHQAGHRARLVLARAQRSADRVLGPA